MSENQTIDEVNLHHNMIENYDILEPNHNIFQNKESCLPAKRIRKPVDLEYKPKNNHNENIIKPIGNNNHHKKAKNNTNNINNKDKHHHNTKNFNSSQAIVQQIIEPKTNAFIPPSVALSGYDKAAQLKLSKDLLLCSGCEGGYRMVRATHGVHRGSYYWEVEVLKPESDSAHLRIGWSTRQGELQAPLGFDQYSYAYRDIDGSKVHNSKRIDHYGNSFSVGDVIGCHILLHDDENYNKMSFFKNGIDQGIAYSGLEIPTGLYFPAVSLYMKANIRVNFGPSFIKKPDIYGANAISELQPMNPEDRKLHELMIQSIKQSRGE